MDKEFEKKVSELLNSDDGFNSLGLKHIAQFHTRAGVSSMVSWMAFPEEMDEQALQEIPDYVLSDTLEKDLDVTINVCVWALQKTKYLPSGAQSGSAFGALPEGQREGAYLKNWEDFEILGSEGEPVYTEETLSAFEENDLNRLATAFWLIVKDICDDGGFLSLEWYQARIIYEYFREYPVPPENAFLIGELFKELCIKESYEVELASYYKSLANSQEARQKGASATRQKADELRNFCVDLFVKLVESVGPRMMFAPAEIQARELREIALKERPDDFLRSGKPYSVEWFLRNVIEDRKLEIIEALEQRQSDKRL